MNNEEDFFNKEEAEVIDILPQGLIPELKAQRDTVNQIYAKLIANPYLAPTLIPDMRSALMGTLATLMENGVPVSDDPKIRTPEDVIREGMAELGGMIGVKGLSTLIRMRKNFSDSMGASDTEEGAVYRDPDTNTFYYIDAEGSEIDCDEYGNPMED